MSGQIFISYRREDSQGSTGRLYDRLRRHFSPEQVFMDVVGIEPGLDFVKAIEEQVSRCDVLIAVIGPRWLQSTDDEGLRRLNNPEDFVRLEIATALKRNIRVIPVLVEGATMPRSNDLPDELKPLVRRSAVELGHAGFREDLTRLLRTVKSVMQKAERQPGAVEPGPQEESATLPQNLRRTDRRPTPVKRQVPKTPVEGYRPTTPALDRDASAVGVHASLQFPASPDSATVGSRNRLVGQYDAALVALNRALVSNPADAWVIADRADVYRLMGQLHSALADSDRAIQMHANDAWALATRGETHRLLGRYREGLEDLNASLRLQPDDAWALACRGETLRLMQRYNEAEEDLGRAIKLQPNLAWALACRGETRRLLGDYDHALSDFNDATALQSDSAWAFACRGATHRAVGDSVKAREDFERAVELEPSNARFMLLQLGA